MFYQKSDAQPLLPILSLVRVTRAHAFRSLADSDEKETSEALLFGGAHHIHSLLTGSGFIAKSCEGNAAHSSSAIEHPFDRPLQLAAFPRRCCLCTRMHFPCLPEECIDRRTLQGRKTATIWSGGEVEKATSRSIEIGHTRSVSHLLFASISPLGVKTATHQSCARITLVGDACGQYCQLACP